MYKLGLCVVALLTVSFLVLHSVLTSHDDGYSETPADPLGKQNKVKGVSRRERSLDRVLVRRYIVAIVSIPY